MPGTRVTAPFFIAAALAVAAGAAAAHQGASGVVRTRMEMMKAIAGEMKVVGEMVRGRSTFDPALADAAAGRIARYAKAIPTHFPEGSVSGPSEALPAIWEDWDHFSGLAERLGTNADALGGAAAQADAGADLVPAFRDVAATCKACHERYRVKR